jgi:aminopeptidase N
VDVSSEKPQRIYRADYQEPDYWIDSVDLDFDLGDDITAVGAKLSVRRNPALRGDSPPLILVGEELSLKGLWIDGEELDASRYRVGELELSINSVPERFELTTLVEIKPQENTSLSGLYRTSGNFCTQCEAMGFRRITYFLDRPDVMARYTTTITADKATCPVMLSNGNRVAEEELQGGRHRVRWEDPFLKPSYLFALVAGDLRCHSGTFVTQSGRNITLEIWVEPQNVDSCEHALQSLQRAMKWDEEVFGLEYDLDIYMIVAVNDFNMGAMENKGLNVFNSKYVLARPETATDDDYEGVEGVIGHEYFHNWTGNRVTCRDWFQLTLKEGLTVFRDQKFSADMTSKAVKRIDEVKFLRVAQFAEDEGPMAHPIRPESYISMDNFYTSTVYDKGAEVVRMAQTLLGAAGFRRGMDLYFERHDGCAVACDDFRAAMADANEYDLGQFGLWYSQAGTPRVEGKGEWDGASGCYRLTLTQGYPEAAYEIEGAQERKPLHIPIVMGLIGPSGEALPLVLEGEDSGNPSFERVLELRESEESFVFTGLSGRPVASLARGFSAPIKLKMDRSRGDLAFLMGHDSDEFNRWDAGQELAMALLLDLVADAGANKEMRLDDEFSAAFGRVLNDTELDGSLKALALTLPGEKVIGQEMKIIDPDAVHAARQFLRRALAEAHRDGLQRTYDASFSQGPYSNDKASIDRRRLGNVALAYLSALEGPEAVERLSRQFEAANNMTDSQAALGLLVDCEGAQRDAALQTFYDRWHADPLVLDKWFSVQALTRLPDALEKVLALSRHPDFSLKNPNRLRSLIAVFCSGNPVHFHRTDGAGYRFLADSVLELDPMNPQVSARLVSLFNQWRRFDTQRQALMKAQLERIAEGENLSKDVFEIVGRALS